VYGNGGLLTTVGDLLKWNENFAAPVVGDAALVAEQQQVGTFNDGRPHHYAFGLEVGTYRGVRQVDHSGSTAGYRAHLARYPDQHVSVAVLCNVTSGAATQFAHAVGDIYLGDRLQPAAPPAATYTLTAADLDRLAGLYRNTKTGVPVTMSRDGGGIRTDRASLVAVSASRFTTTSGTTWEFDGRGGAKETDSYGTIDQYERVAAATPVPAQLAELAGTYVSDEAETALTVSVSGNALIVRQRPDTVRTLTPVYADAFTAPQLGLVIFRRDGSGRVAELSIVEDRVWDLRFARQAGRSGTSQ